MTWSARNGGSLRRSLVETSLALHHQTPPFMEAYETA